MSQVQMEATQDEAILRKLVRDDFMMTKAGLKLSFSKRRPSKTLKRPKRETQEEGLSKAKNGRWSIMEHVRFLEALKMFGKDWKRIEECVKTRSRA